MPLLATGSCIWDEEQAPHQPRPHSRGRKGPGHRASSPSTAPQGREPRHTRVPILRHCGPQEATSFVKWLEWPKSPTAGQAVASYFLSPPSRPLFTPGWAVSHPGLLGPRTSGPQTPIMHEPARCYWPPLLDMGGAGSHCQGLPVADDQQGWWPHTLARACLATHWALGCWDPGGFSRAVWGLVMAPEAM